ncbi:flagellar basal body rod protein FlgB [Paenibacillus sp. y28]|uniref:flagellar basal body rod protein FlgB n=1 Tax=Paenibacillus sp. y28 TaxID=3129110 RepID=UPI00301A01BA
MFLLNKPSMSLMERTLDAAVLRQNVISNNIANVDTPRFKRSDVRFEEYLQKELGQLPKLEGYRTDPRHFYIGRQQPQSATIERDDSTTINNDLNNVDIDSEMSLLAKNQLRYNVLIQQENNEFKKIRTAIGGR